MKPSRLLSNRFPFSIIAFCVLMAVAGCPDPYDTYGARLDQARHLPPYPTSQAYDSYAMADNGLVVVGSATELGYISAWRAMALKVDSAAAGAWSHIRPVNAPAGWTSVAEQGGDIVAIGHNSGGVLSGRSALARWNAQTGALKDLDEYGTGVGNYQDEYVFWCVAPGPRSRCLISGQIAPLVGSERGLVMAVDALGTVQWDYDSTFIVGTNLPANTPTSTVAERVQQISDDALLVFGTIRTDFSATVIYDANFLAKIDLDGEGLWVQNYVVGKDLTGKIFEPQIQAVDGGGYRIIGTNSSMTPCPVFELTVDADGEQTIFRQIPTGAYALNDLVALADGGFLVGGTIREEGDAPYTPLDAYVARIGADGITMWERRIGRRAQDEYGDTVAVLADGNYALVLSVRVGNNLDARMVKLTPGEGEILW